MADDATKQKQKQKKLLLPFLDRAEEIKKANPKVAYYCRLYAVEQAVALGEKNLHPDVLNVVMAVMEELAKTKPGLDLNKAGDAELCVQWAKMVFARADKLDRSCTAENVPLAGRSFVSAEQFFRVASQFGALPPEVQQLQKYALWRGVELLKAYKERRAPTPPPAVGANRMSTGEEKELEAGLTFNASLPMAPSGLPSSTIGTAAPAGPNIAIPPPIVPPAAHPSHHPFPPPAPSRAFAHAPPPSPAADAPALRPSRFLKEPPPRQFTPGQAVKYCPDGNMHSLREDAEVRAVRTNRYGELEYTIYLTRRRQELVVSGELLAPMIAVGTEMLYFPKEGGTAERVEVEEVYASKWPPSYLVKRPGRGLVDVEDERLMLQPAPQQQPEQQAPVLAAPPPAAAAVPPPPQPPAASFPLGLATVEESASGELASEEAVSAAIAGAEAEYAAQEQARTEANREKVPAANVGDEVGYGLSAIEEEDDSKFETESALASAIAAEVMAEVKDEEAAAAAAAAATEAAAAGGAQGVGAAEAAVRAGAAGVAALSGMAAAAATEAGEERAELGRVSSLPPSNPPLLSPLGSGPVAAREAEPSSTAYPASVPLPSQPSSSQGPPAAAVLSHPVSPPKESEQGGPSPASAADPNFTPSLEEITEATKVLKTAGSALAFEDVPTAVKFLEDALRMLTNKGGK